MRGILEYLRNMQPATRWSLGVGSALLLALTISLIWWATRTVYSPLYQDLDEQDLAQVAATLDKWHVTYRYGRDGASIEVPEGAVADARMRLATEGVPAHGNVGLEIFDNADYGMTEFAQKVNYQRAIQGELERTIMALKEVKFARVHLTMKQADLFLKDEEAPKASVTIAMREGSRLSPRQISGIQNLVSAAVEGLDPKSVIVVDDQGEALSGSASEAGSPAEMDARMQEQSKVETTLRQKISAMLGDTLGLKNVAVSVNVVLNFDHVKHTEQKVLTGPDGTGFVTHHQETNAGPTGNQAGAVQAAHTPATSSVTDYESGKSYEEVEYAQGRVQRISVGIIVPASLSPDQQQHLRDVISAAAGLDASRGDQIQLVTMNPARQEAASPQPVQVKTASPATQSVATSPQAALPGYARWVILGLLILLGVSLTANSLLRPRARRLSPERRDAVLVEIRRWLDEPGE